MKLEGAERKVLRAIVRDYDPNREGCVADSRIALIDNMDVQDVRDTLKSLGDKGFVDLIREKDGLSASATPKGRQALRLVEPIESTSVDGEKARGVSVLSTPSGVITTPKPAFKGLGSYDRDDADYFLKLLPGRPNQDGLPPCIQFW